MVDLTSTCVYVNISLTLNSFNRNIVLLMFFSFESSVLLCILYTSMFFLLTINCASEHVNFGIVRYINTVYK